MSPAPTPHQDPIGAILRRLIVLLAGLLGAIIADLTAEHDNLPPRHPSDVITYGWQTTPAEVDHLLPVKPARDLMFGYARYRNRGKIGSRSEVAAARRHAPALGRKACKKKRSFHLRDLEAPKLADQA